MDIKITVIDMFRKIDDRMEHFTMEVETIRNNQMDLLKVTIALSEIKNSIDEGKSHWITAAESEMK